jgi:hypothetical protein
VASAELGQGHGAGFTAVWCTQTWLLPLDQMVHPLLIRLKPRYYDANQDTML